MSQEIRRININQEFWDAMIHNALAVIDQIKARNSQKQTPAPQGPDYEAERLIRPIPVDTKDMPEISFERRKEYSIPVEPIESNQ